MDTWLTVILSLLVFGFLIFIHEFGHYITARIFKVSISEFSIGMGPRLFTIKSKKTDIRYSISALPIGGYVAMVGENEESTDPNSFDKKPAWQRFIITAAGAFVNILAGFIAMLVIVGMIKIGGTEVGEFYTDETLLGYGEIDVTNRSSDVLKLHDVITHVNGKKVVLADELSYQIMRYGNSPVDLTVIRDGEEIVLRDVVFPILEEQGQEFGMMDFKVYEKEKTFGNFLSISFRKAVLVMRMCWESIIDLISGRYTFAAVSGPVGISSAIGDAAKLGFLSLLNITLLISMNLGFMNLLPIPALDGGRLLTITVEMITRKKLNPKVEGMINAIGLMLLLGLSFLILIKDVFQILA